ncbi:MAG: sigma-54-dependent Fis family transcriptional regulator [Deltaproteobacteria bacterium]|nr:MAG: sigma-54-dependent Fis family transcriptional regulator [Deltaproteobacteria bacterium]
MRGHKVLVVEDEREMQRALEAVLEGCGLRVSTAEDGLHAVTKFKQDLYDLVIADVRMPRMSGLELLKEIKRISPLTPVVLLTAYGTVEGAVNAMKEGAFDYIEKPFSPEVLEEVVKRALASRPEEEKQKRRTIIAQDPKMLELLEVARTIAPSTAPVLISGESGTGKELLARYIHEQSQRRGRPFVAVNCAALPEGLLETELFGHERGSFTGAVAQKKGKFELAHRGTLLLDEVSEMPLALQAKILRALQEGEIDRVGGTKPVAVDVRVIATTNRDLVEEVHKGRFREDLFFRLNVVPLHIPPLRERKGDIPLLANFFLEKYAALNGKGIKGFSPETMKLLEEYSWPGNVRELENVVHRAVLLAKGPVIEPKDLVIDEGLVSRIDPPIKPGTSLKEMERWLILETLKKVGGNRTQAAKLLGVSVRTIRNKLKEYKINGKDLAA